MKTLAGILMMAATLAFAGITFAQSTTASKPATTTSQPALPACCGDTCKKMVGCCKADAAGKVTCAMGGTCCVKTSTAPAPATSMPGMPGMGGMMK